MSERQRWADVAKGLCIVLVVLWHVTRKDYLQLPWAGEGPVTGAWGSLSEVLLPVRMPLFFLISGLFATRWVERPWRRVWVGRVAPVLYLFVLWTLLHTAVLQLTPGFDTAVAHSPHDLLVQLTITPGNLWYLLALPAYVAVARATRGAPGVALTAAVLLSAVAAAGWVPTPGNRYGLLTNLVWFLLGTRLTQLPTRARAVLVPTTARLAAACGAVFLLAAAAWQVLGADGWFGVRPALGLVGIAAGAGVAVLVSRTRLGEPLAGLGRQTLPVYVLHLPLVALVHLGSSRLVDPGSPASRWVPLAALYPLLVTFVVVAACLLLHRVLRRAGAPWLFEAPWLLRSGGTATPPARARGRRPRSAPGRAAPASAGSRPRGS